MDDGTMVLVARDDVARGEPGDPEACPVALALKRLFPGQRIAVQPAGIRVEKAVHRCPDDVRRWCDAFHSGERVEPFAFKLPEPWTRSSRVPGWMADGRVETKTTVVRRKDFAPD